jgi:hypothetical protein
MIADMNPTVRGFVVIALVAAVIVALQLYQTLVALTLLVQIGFLLAVAFFVYLVWRERRSEIGEWSARAQIAFYGAALLVVADIGAYWFIRPSGLDAAAFLLVLVLCAVTMIRTWRDQHSYS